MLILPILATALFLLVLALKLLGGHIAWWIIITFSIILLVPTLILLFLEIKSRMKR